MQLDEDSGLACSRRNNLVVAQLSHYQQSLMVDHTPVRSVSCDDPPGWRNLVAASVRGADARKGVGVQIPPRALSISRLLDPRSVDFGSRLVT